MIDTDSSMVDAAFEVRARAAGSLIGSYEEEAKPTATRTKPGLLGAFGPTENEPIPATFAPDAQGAIRSPASGFFLLAVDPNAGTVSMSGLAAELLDSGAAHIPASAAIGFQSFRTRNPTSTFIGASLPIPLGMAEVSSLALMQVPGEVLGTLAPIAPDRYAFAVTPMVVFNAQASFLGNEFEAPGTPMALPLVGEIALSGGVAIATAMAEIAISSNANPEQELPPFEFGLPTLLPPGQRADVILNLVLEEISLQFGGALQLRATGTAIPEPRAVSVLLLSMLIRRRCRR